MTRKQKKTLTRILTAAALLVLLHFLPLSDILENIFGSSEDGAAPVLRRIAIKRVRRTVLLFVESVQGRKVLVGNADHFEPLAA